MEIVNIKKLNKKYKLEFDNEKSIYVSENTIIKFNLVKKIKITVDQYKKILLSENKEQAVNLSLNYLSYAMKTEYELREYLRKKEIFENNIDYAVEKVKEYKYLDDEKYAKIFINEYFNLKKKGPIWIKKKLEEKRVNEQYINNNILTICTDSEQIEAVYLLIEKEYGKKNEAINKKIKKITTKLYANGYTFDIINKAFKIFLENNNEENDDSEIISKYFDKAYSKLSKKYDDKYILKQKIVEKLLRDGFNYGDIKDYFLEIDF